MKPVIALVLAAGALGFAGAAFADTKAPPNRLAWLAGCWRSADAVSMETWSEPEGGIFFGYATMTKGGVMSFFEQSRIDTRQARATYVVSPNGDRPVTFVEAPPKPVVVDPKKKKEEPQPEITFVNGDHDFPQRIQYRSEGRKALAATISNLDGSKPVEYRWERCKN